MPYGAFVEIEPGLDGLLHISDISRARVAKPEDVLSVGQQLTLRILKIDPETKKISLGLKQLQPEPWETAAERYLPGQRITGARHAPHGLRRIRRARAGPRRPHSYFGDVVGEESPPPLRPAQARATALTPSFSPSSRRRHRAGRIALGLKQTLADPWLEVERKFPVGSQVEGPVTKIMNFGAFVQIAEGVDGLVHISEIVADRRINHPRDVLREGQRVKALVLAIDQEKRQIKLSMKQLIPTSIDEYIAEHKRATASPAASSSSRLPARWSNSAKASAPLAVGQPRLRRKNLQRLRHNPSLRRDRAPRPTSRSSPLC